MSSSAERFNAATAGGSRNKRWPWVDTCRSSSRGGPTAIGGSSPASAFRRVSPRAIALQRLHGHRIEIVTAEMVVYEWLREAPTPTFRAILPLIR